MIVGSFPYFLVRLTPLVCQTPLAAAQAGYADTLDCLQEVQPVFGALAAETVGDLAILGDEGPTTSSGQLLGLAPGCRCSGAPRKMPGDAATEWGSGECSVPWLPSSAVSCKR